MPWVWFALVPIPITNIVIAPFWDYAPITEWWKAATQALVASQMLMLSAGRASVGRRTAP